VREKAGTSTHVKDDKKRNPALWRLRELALGRRAATVRFVYGMMSACMSVSVGGMMPDGCAHAAWGRCRTRHRTSAPHKKPRLPPTPPIKRKFTPRP